MVVNSLSDSSESIDVVCVCVDVASGVEVSVEAAKQNMVNDPGFSRAQGIEQHVTTHGSWCDVYTVCRACDRSGDDAVIEGIEECKDC